MTREQWLASTEALLDLDAKGALVPHGIGGHARTLLEEARRHLSAVPDGEGELVERLLMTAVDMERKFLHRIDHLGEDWKLVNPNGETAAALLREAASRLSQAEVRVTDEMVERFAAELWKLDDAYARSIPHSKIRIALEAAISGDTL